jgi:arylsulfatase A-like enzyme
MVEHLDRQMGHLLDRLRASGRDRRTLVLFIGDNGTNKSITSICDGRPVTGGKGSTADAGTHVPFIAWWPGRIAPGVADDLVESTDILPTLAELAGAQLPVPCDGISLVPRLLYGTPSPRQAIYGWYARGGPTSGKVEIWARDRRWKLYDDGRMYDVLADPGEQSPAAAADPQARLRLQAELDRYASVPTAAGSQRR